MEYHIWCDESDRKGAIFSNFYGAAMVSSVDLEEVLTSLRSKKQQLNLYGEVKWIKVSANYLTKYQELISTYFQLVVQGKIKTRIMFSSNRYQPVGLTKEHEENEYFLLYHQFVKHAFGLATAPFHRNRTGLHINFDRLPDKAEKAMRFKQYIFGLNKHINLRNIYLPKDNISEVVSHEHEVLQCVDIITGAMSFRLNRKHLEKIPGKRVRGKKTIAKELLYKHINQEIRNLYKGKNFNVGVSTGFYDGEFSRWSMPYRHWLFVPKNHTLIIER